MTMLEDTVGFWDQRHAALDPWLAGGDRGLTAAENYEFYAYRLGRIVELIRRHASCDRGLRILDAGSGRGHFTDGLRRCGHDVRGCDASPTAVSWATAAYGPHFDVATLEDYRPCALFDVVICIDVLFHILDDRAWAASLQMLGRAASVDSLLIVSDAFGPQRFALGNYIIHRPLEDYDRALAALDFHRGELMPYVYGSNPNQFAAYRRDP